MANYMDLAKKRKSNKERGIIVLIMALLNETIKEGLKQEKSENKMKRQ